MSFIINTNIQDIIQRGNEVIEPEYAENWENTVQNVHNSWLAYGDTVLDYALDIIKELNNECSFHDVKETLRKQNHSGISYSLVCGIINEFCSKGTGFIQYADSHWYD